MSGAFAAAGGALIVAELWLVLTSWLRQAIFPGVLGAVGIALLVFSLAAGTGAAGAGALIFALIALMVGTGLYGLAVALERFDDEPHPSAARSPGGYAGYVLSIAPIVAVFAIAGPGGFSSHHARHHAASQKHARARARQPGPVITVRSSQYGRILTDGGNHTIYLFTRDKSTSSTCYGACAVAWPPVLTKGTPQRRGGLPAVLGTTRRSDGTLQVTYAGHPLYYYVNDVKPGQILCQNVDEFGGTWLVISPAGNAIR